MRKRIINIAKLPGTYKAAMPSFIQPQLCTPGTPPEGDDWLHEMKFDGYRILTFIKKRKIKLISRNDKDWTEKFPEITAALKPFANKNAILDGELVALNRKGISKFQLLQDYMENHQHTKLAYYIFDILYYDNFNLTKIPLLERKALLLQLLGSSNKVGTINFTQHIVGQGKKVFKKACKQGLEGIISKRIGSLYTEKRTKDWTKSKCLHEEEFVIAGFTDPGGSRQYFGALLLGYYDKKKHLIFCGHVGTGFDHKTLKNLYHKMKPLEQKKSPFYQTPFLKNVHWLKPKLVGEIKFLEFTNEGILRQPVFLGLRADKSAKEVTLE